MANLFEALANLTVEEEEEAVGSTAPGGDRRGRPVASAESGGAEGEGREGDGEESGEGEASSRAGFDELAMVWIDLEMTGLDVERDTIIQIACVITDKDAERSVEGPEIVIGHDDASLAAMNEWCVEQHGKSGLTEAARQSHVTETEAEDAVLEFLDRHLPLGVRYTLAGSSVHVDLGFLKRRMPRLAARLHWRIVDVTSLLELQRRWFAKPPGGGGRPERRPPPAHTALADVRASIRLLRQLRTRLFRGQSGSQDTSHARGVQVRRTGR